MDDELTLLVVRCQLGERDALASLVRQWHRPLWNYLRRMADSTDIADELSQETWVAVLRGLPRLCEPERFPPWLFTIARRTAMNRLRERYADRRRDEAAGSSCSDGGPDGSPGFGGASDEVVDRVELLAGLADLPLLEREVLVLFHLHDLSLRDCATVLGVPQGTVKSRLARARELLRTRMLRKGFHRDR